MSNATKLSFSPTSSKGKEEISTCEISASSGKTDQRAKNAQKGFCSISIITETSIPHRTASQDYDDPLYINVREDNWPQIIKSLSKNDPDITSLKIDFFLTPKLMTELQDAIKQGNTALGHILWHKEQLSCQTLEQIELHLINNNKNFKSHPSDIVHGFLCKHVYNDSKKSDLIALDPQLHPHLKDWKVVKVFDSIERTSYYAVLYYNNKSHQMVLAVRGEVMGALDTLKELFSTNGYVKNYIDEILGGTIVVGQQEKHYEATEYALKKAKEKKCRLSFTGYSLGAWLAELSVFYCRAFFSQYNIDIKAVTFDSPGSKRMMERLQSNIINRETCIKLKDLPIITYLTPPNPFNCCDGHVGKVMQVEVDRKGTWRESFDEKAPDCVKRKISAKVHSLFAMEEHDLSKILETFDPETGQPKQCEEMVDWPMIDKGTKTFASDASSLIKQGIEELLKLALIPIVPTVGAVILGGIAEWIVGDTTLMTLIGFLITGDIESTQYKSYFEHIDKGTISNNNFALSGKSHFRKKQEIVTYIMNLKRGSPDEFLYNLFLEYRPILQNNTSFLGPNKRQIKDLLSAYTIEKRNDGQHLLRVNSGYNFDIREYAKRLQKIINIDFLKLGVQLPTPLENQRTIHEFFAKQISFSPKSTVTQNLDSASLHAPENVVESSISSTPYSNRRLMTCVIVGDLEDLNKLLALFSNEKGIESLARMRQLHFSESFIIKQNDVDSFKQLLKAIAKNSDLIPDFSVLSVGKIDEGVKIKFPKMHKLKGLTITKVGAKVSLNLNGCNNLESLTISLCFKCKLKLSEKFDNLKTLSISEIYDSTVICPKNLDNLRDLSVKYTWNDSNISFPKSFNNLKNLALLTLNDLAWIQSVNSFPTVESLTIDSIRNDEPYSFGKDLRKFLGIPSIQKKDLSFFNKFTGLTSLRINVLSDNIILEFPNLDCNLKTVSFGCILDNVCIEPSKLFNKVTELSIDRIGSRIFRSSNIDDFKLPDAFFNLQTLSVASIEQGSTFVLPNTLKNLKKFTIKDIAPDATVKVRASYPRQAIFTVGIVKNNATLVLSRLIDKETKTNMRSIWQQAILPS